MNLNIIIAALLTLLTTLLGYSAWYIVRGRQKKEKALRREYESELERKKEKESADGKNPQAGPAPGSYCYPKINELMGFEFITVVSIPKDLRQAESRPENREPTWDKSETIGLRGVSSGEEKENDSLANQEQGRRAFPADSAGRGSSPSPVRTPLRENRQEEDPEEVEEVSTYSELTPEMLEQINALEGWNDRDENEQFSDEQLDIILGRNTPQIEERDEPGSPDTSISQDMMNLARQTLDDFAQAQKDSGRLGRMIDAFEGDDETDYSLSGPEDEDRETEEN